MDCGGKVVVCRSCHHVAFLTPGAGAEAQLARLEPRNAGPAEAGEARAKLY